MEKAGKMMWKLIVNANWRRARIRALGSTVVAPPGLELRRAFYWDAGTQQLDFMSNTGALEGC
jgi:hypothetical protein